MTKPTTHESEQSEDEAVKQKTMNSEPVKKTLLHIPSDNLTLRTLSWKPFKAADQVEIQI